MRRTAKITDIMIIVILILIIASVIIFICLPGATVSPGSDNTITLQNNAVASGYNGKRAGIITGTMQDSIVSETFPDSPRSEFSNYPDMIAAIHSDKIDYFIADIDITGAFIEDDPELMCIKDPVAVLECGAMFPKNDKGEKLRDRFNEFLAKVNADGTWNEIQKFWKSSEAEGASVDMSGLTGENGTLVLAVSGKGAPYSYISNGKTAGADPDLAVRFCREYGYGIDIRIVDFGEIIPGLTSGVYDFAADGVIITEERKESVYFSDPYLMQEYDLVALKQTDTANSAVEDRPFSYYADNKKIGVITGGLYEVMIKERFPDADLYQYNNQADLGAALDAGLIDCFTVPRSTAEDFKKQYNGFTYLNEVFTQIPYGFAFEKSAGKEYLRDQMNEFLKKIHSDGTYDEIVSVWFGDDEDKKTVDVSRLAGRNGSLRMVTTATMQPFSYIKDGNNVGLEIDIVTRFCREYGYSLDISNAEFSSLIPGITSGMYNIASGNIMITKERAESVNFSDVYYTADAVAVVKNESSAMSPYKLNRPEYTIGFGTGSSAMFAVEKYLPDAQHLNYDSHVTGFEAVRLGLLDAYVFDRNQMQAAIDNGLTGVMILPENLGENTEVAIGLSRSSAIPDLKDNINSFLAELRADGTLDDMRDRWTVRKDYTMPKITKPESPSMKIIVGTTGTVEPYSFYKDNTLTGFDIELAERLGARMNAEIEYRIYNFSGLITAAGSGEIDCIFANLNVTPERKETIDFSDPIYFIENSVMVADSEKASPSGESLFDSIASSFEKNFIREERWKLILKGIGITCFITALSTLFGTLLAFLICMFRRTESRLAITISDIYVKLLQGTPLVVLLMILYYVIFGRSGLDAVWVAVIGFSLNVGAYVSEIMRSGIESIDNGQREAALALGYSENQAFFRFIFPQALTRFLPIYRGEIVSLLKSTSIVGYIAIQDLTKMSDIIRSRTYEAFFPLIATAIIYFILSWIISVIIKVILKAVSHGR